MLKSSRNLTAKLKNRSKSTSSSKGRRSLDSLPPEIISRCLYFLAMTTRSANSATQETPRFQGTMTVRLNASAADEPRCTLILSRLLTLSRTLYPIVVQLLETYVDLYDAEAAKRYGGMLDRQVESSQRCLRLNVWHDVVGGANEEAYAEVLRIISMLPQLRWLSVPPSPAMVDVVSRCQDLRTYIYTVQSGTKKHHDCPSLSNAVHLSSRLAARLPQLRHLLLTAQRHHPVTLVSGPSSDYTTLRSLALHVSHLTIPDLYTAARSFPLSLVTLKLVVYSLGNSVSMPTDTEITLAQALEPITAQLRHLEFLIDPPDLQMRPRFQLDPLIPHLTSLKILRVQGLFISREALLPLLPSLCALSLRSSSALHLADVRSLLEDTTNDLRALSAVGSPYEKRPPREVAALRELARQRGVTWWIDEATDEQLSSWLSA